MVGISENAEKTWSRRTKGGSRLVFVPSVLTLQCSSFILNNSIMAITHVLSG